MRMDLYLESCCVVSLYQVYPSPLLKALQSRQFYLVIRLQRERLSIALLVQSSQGDGRCGKTVVGRKIVPHQRSICQQLFNNFFEKKILLKTLFYYLTLKSVGCIMMVCSSEEVALQRGDLQRQAICTSTHTTQTSFSWLARVPEVGRDIIAYFDEKSQHLFHQKIFSFFA